MSAQCLHMISTIQTLTIKNIIYNLNNLSEHDDHDSMKHKLTQMPNHIPAF